MPMACLAHAPLSETWAYSSGCIWAGPGVRENTPTLTLILPLGSISSCPTRPKAEVSLGLWIPLQWRVADDRLVYWEVL